MICLDCLQDKAETEFYRHTRTGLQDVCKPCTVESNRLRRTDVVAFAERKRLRKERRRTVVVPDHKACCRCSNDHPLDAFRVRAKGLFGRSSWCKDCERTYEVERLAGPERERLLGRRRELWAKTPRTAEQKSTAASRARAWYADNKPQRKLTLRQWVEANREAVNIIQARRRAKKAAVLNTLTKAEWEETLTLFNGCCAYCLQPCERPAMDHMDPIAKGGPHTQENVVPACKPCNSSKKDRPIWAMLNATPKMEMNAHG